MPGKRGRPRNPVAPCRFCHRQFKRAEHLERHERIHTQEKPFECGCGERFSRQDLLCRHQRMVGHTGRYVGSEREPSQEQPSRETVIVAELTLPSPQGSAPLTYNEHGGTGAGHGIEGATTSLPMEPEGGSLVPIDPSMTMDLVLPVSAPAMQNAPAQPCVDLAFGFCWDDFQMDSCFLPSSLMDTGMGLSFADTASWRPAATTGQETGAGLGAAAGTPGVRVGGASNTYGGAFRGLTSRLPSLEPDPEQLREEHGPREDTCKDENGAYEAGHGGTPPLLGYAALRPPVQTTSNPWRLTASGYGILRATVARFRDALPPAFVLPPRHALSRYLEGYFRGFHGHLPFLHWPTFSTGSQALELVLALGAIGAMYRFEHARGCGLYTAARAIIDWKLAGRQGTAGENTPNDVTDADDLQLAQARLLLMALASWADGAVAPEAIAMASSIAMLVRDMGISDEDVEDHAGDMVDIADEVGWLAWVRREERRRTLLVAYMLFNLQSVAFNVPPLLLNQEVRVGLPASEAEWTASGPGELRRARLRLAPPARHQAFQRALETLASGAPIHADGPVSAFANHALIHGLVQQLFWARNASSCVADAPAPLPEAFVLRAEAGLRAWQASWEATSESSLDPSSPRGPLGFNSTALLRIAYIRLNAGPGPGRAVFARDPEAIARAFCDEDDGDNGKGYWRAPQLVRSPRLDRAVLQCIHALSIPVRVGLRFVARTQTLSWSIQHTLCNLECALLLTRWLRAVARTVRVSGYASLREDERTLTRMVAGLVRETDFAEELEEGGGGDEADYVEGLASLVLALWSELFKGPNVYHLVRAVGEGLSLAAQRMGSQEDGGDEDPEGAFM